MKKRRNVVRSYKRRKRRPLWQMEYIKRRWNIEAKRKVIREITRPAGGKWQWQIWVTCILCNQYQYKVQQAWWYTCMRQLLVAAAVSTLAAARKLHTKWLFFECQFTRGFSQSCFGPTMCFFVYSTLHLFFSFEYFLFSNFKKLKLFLLE